MKGKVMGEKYFNDDQIAWMRTLSRLPKEKKCDCGWNYRGECFGTCYGHPERGGHPLVEVRKEHIQDDYRNEARTNKEEIS
jgi:hypothetical protein